MLLSSNLRKRLTVLAKQHGIEISIKLKDISVNGQKRGCSGFVTCGESCVYVNTEHTCFGPIFDKSMCRYAYNTKDFSSNRLKNGYNQFVSDDALAAKVISMLKSGKAIKAIPDSRTLDQ